MSAPLVTTPLVAIDGVDMRYAPQGTGKGTGEGTLAVRDLTLHVDEGEFVAVVGPSGCGKSTLMKLVTGLHVPQTGAIHVDDKRVAGPVSIVGMAFQNPTMLPWRSTLDNVLMPLEVVKEHRGTFRRRRAEHVAEAERLLKIVGLEGFGDKYPWQLSGGMQQRANLCRALIHRPRLLMLDEPFGALDAFTREELWQVIRDLHAEQGITIVLVTHDLREAVFLADRVFVMSVRPGTITSVRTVPFARPRDIELMYEKDFADVVHGLRDEIAENRGVSA